MRIVIFKRTYTLACWQTLHKILVAGGSDVHVDLHGHGIWMLGSILVFAQSMGGAIAGGLNICKMDLGLVDDKAYRLLQGDPFC